MDSGEKLRRSKRRSVKHDTEESRLLDDTCVIEERLKRLMSAYKREFKPRSLFSDFQESVPKIRRSVVVRSYQDIVCSTPLIVGKKRKFFNSDASLSISPIYSTSEELQKSHSRTAKSFRNQNAPKIMSSDEVQSRKSRKSLNTKSFNKKSTVDRSGSTTRCNSSEYINEKNDKKNSTKSDCSQTNLLIQSKCGTDICNEFDVDLIKSLESNLRPSRTDQRKEEQKTLNRTRNGRPHTRSQSQKLINEETKQSKLVQSEPLNSRRRKNFRKTKPVPIKSLIEEISDRKNQSLLVSSAHNTSKKNIYSILESLNSSSVPKLNLTQNKILNKPAVFNLQRKSTSEIIHQQNFINNSNNNSQCDKENPGDIVEKTNTEDFKMPNKSKKIRGARLKKSQKKGDTNIRNSTFNTSNDTKTINDDKIIINGKNHILVTPLEKDKFHLDPKENEISKEVAEKRRNKFDCVLSEDFESSPKNRSSGVRSIESEKSNFKIKKSRELRSKKKTSIENDVLMTLAESSDLTAPRRSRRERKVPHRRIYGVIVTCSQRVIQYCR